jgi:hypothetical protein
MKHHDSVGSDRISSQSKSLLRSIGQVADVLASGGYSLITPSKRQNQSSMTKAQSSAEKVAEALATGGYSIIASHKNT